MSSKHFSANQIQREFPELVETMSGDPSRLFSDITPTDGPKDGTFVFCSKQIEADVALQNSSLGVILPSKVWKGLQTTDYKDQTIIVSPNVGLLLALATKRFLVSPVQLLDKNTGIHSTAIISRSATIHATATIGPHVVVGPRCSIGAGSWIGPHTVIEDDCLIGENTRLEPFVHVARSTRIGSFCFIKSFAAIGMEGFGFAHTKEGKHIRIPQRGNVVIEDSVEIGTHCAVDRATFGETLIGEGTKLDNRIHVGHNCRIGKNGIITAGAVLAGSVTIGDNFLSGGNISVTDHVNITDNVQLGGLAGVGKDISEPGAYGGYPLQKIRDYLKTTANFIHLTRMRKDLHKILQHLKLDSSDSVK